MPNLEHDAQNPTDLLGRTIAAGDVVAWGTTYGRSPAVCVAVIEKIRFIQKSCSANGWKNREVPQPQADDYTLTLRPVHSTGDITWLKDDGEEYREWRDGFIPRDKLSAKLKSVQVVKNIIKLDKTEADILKELA